MRAGSATHLGMGGAIVGLAKRIGANCAAIAAAPRNGRSARGDAPAEVATPADGTKRTLSRGPIVSLSRPRFYLYFDLRDLPSDSAGRNARH